MKPGPFHLHLRTVWVLPGTTQIPPAPACLRRSCCLPPAVLPAVLPAVQLGWIAACRSGFCHTWVPAWISCLEHTAIHTATAPPGSCTTSWVWIDAWIPLLILPACRFTCVSAYQILRLTAPVRTLPPLPGLPAGGLPLWVPAWVYGLLPGFCSA